MCVGGVSFADHLDLNKIRGRSQTMLTRFGPFFDHLPPSVDISYLMNVDKKWPPTLLLLET